MNENKIYRLIDANLNRAREGLRVIEDTARFILNDSKLYRGIRILRHRLTEITRKNYPSLLKARNSAADAGRVIREYRRKNVRDLMIANFRRVEEALRVLEEYSRLISVSAGAQFKNVRFRTYSFEKYIMEVCD
jgi:thiamine-phosphate pyrophosphorylase